MRTAGTRITSRPERPSERDLQRLIDSDSRLASKESPVEVVLFGDRNVAEVNDLGLGSRGRMLSTRRLNPCATSNIAKRRLALLILQVAPLPCTGIFQSLISASTREVKLEGDVTYVTGGERGT